MCVALPCVPRSVLARRHAQHRSLAATSIAVSVAVSVTRSDMRPAALSIATYVHGAVRCLVRYVLHRAIKRAVCTCSTQVKLASHEVKLLFNAHVKLGDRSELLRKKREELAAKGFTEARAEKAWEAQLAARRDSAGLLRAEARAAAERGAAGAPPAADGAGAAAAGAEAALALAAAEQAASLLLWREALLHLDSVPADVFYKGNGEEVPNGEAMQTQA